MNSVGDRRECRVATWFHRLLLFLGLKRPPAANAELLRSALEALKKLELESCKCAETEDEHRILWAQRFLSSHQGPLDDANRVLYGTNTGGVDEPLRLELEQAYSARVAELRAILKSSLPDLRRQISDFPWGASTLAAGGLTAFGAIWALGYFAVLGIPVLPLLRDPADLLLIGVSAGVAPIAIFAIGASLVLLVAARRTLAGKRHTATVSEMSVALKTLRKVRDPSYWLPRTTGGFFFTLLTAVAVGAAVRSGGLASSDTAVVLAGQKCHQMLAPVGALGRFTIFRSKTLSNDDAVFISVPAEDIVRLVTQDAGQGGECVGEIATDTSARIEIMPIVMREQPWWQYAIGITQCRVLKSVSSTRGHYDPLLFPVFEAGASDRIDLKYYKDYPATWPFGPATSEREIAGRSANDTAVKEAAQQIASTILAAGSQVQFLYFVGFASGESNPERNQELAGDRARFVRDLVKFEMDCGPNGKPGCPKMRAISGGEMPDVPWAGRGGDASKRTVLVAACGEEL